MGYWVLSIDTLTETGREGINLRGLLYENGPSSAPAHRQFTWSIFSYHFNFQGRDIYFTLVYLSRYVTEYVLSMLET